VNVYFAGARLKYWVAIGLTVFYVALGSLS
jgi:hypothetical protein